MFGAVLVIVILGVVVLFATDADIPVPAVTATEVTVPVLLVCEFQVPELPPLAYTTPVAVIFNALKSSYPVPGLSLITIVPFDSIAILEATTPSQ